MFVFNKELVQFISLRQEALALQDKCAQECTAAYRQVTWCYKNTTLSVQPINHVTFTCCAEKLLHLLIVLEIVLKNVKDCEMIFKQVEVSDHDRKVALTMHCYHQELT